MPDTVHPKPRAEAGREGGLFSKPVLSWALYDLGNTIFSMNIVSYFLGLWVVTVMGQTDTIWAWATSLSMLAMLITAPILGAISDQAGKRMGLLLISTIGCVTLTFFLGVPGVMGTLVLFVFANYFFQAGLVFYDALLPVVSQPENRGRVSGFGVGLGYVGAFIGLGVGTLLQTAFSYQAAFKVTAILFLVFAVPIFLFVKEPSHPSRIRKGHMIRDAMRQLAATARQVREYRGLGRFLIGRAFYTDAANTLILFMGIYAAETMGYADVERNALFLSAIGAAVVGGFLWGPIVDRAGPKRTLNFVLLCWLVTLIIGALIPMLGLPRGLFWGVAGLAGISLGGTWSADRPLMLILSPPAKIGEFYGLYSMVGRFAAVVGPLLWAFVAEDLGLGRPASVLTLAVMIVIAFLVLRRVDDEPRDWTAEEMGVEAA